ncbi:MAG: hypothetical protein JWO79_382 [Actinomycetia bacterium]|nr:hypothetical protein [Actinomycetes bacterium]
MRTPTGPPPRTGEAPRGERPTGERVRAGERLIGGRLRPGERLIGGRLRPGERIAFAAFGVLFAASWWHPPFPAEQLLHHSLTVIALAGLAVARRRLALPVSSVLLVLVFLALHTIAARWIYSFVPYDAWWRAITGSTLSSTFGWHRNHFDRLVHLSYGLCLAPVLVRYFTGIRGWRPAWAAVAAAEIVLSTSAFYELFEWAIAMTLAPDAAEAYNGQQGDQWDAHKDMAIAFAGALLAAPLAAFVLRGGTRIRPRRGAPTLTG